MKKRLFFTFLLILIFCNLFSNKLYAQKDTTIQYKDLMRAFNTRDSIFYNNLKGFEYILLYKGKKRLVADIPPSLIRISDNYWLIKNLHKKAGPETQIGYYLNKVEIYYDKRCSDNACKFTVNDSTNYMIEFKVYSKKLKIKNIVNCEIGNSAN